MDKGMLFWVVFVIALLFVGWSGRSDPPGLGRSAVFFILVGILGWAVFGPVVK